MVHFSSLFKLDALPKQELAWASILIFLLPLLGAVEINSMARPKEIRACHVSGQKPKAARAVSNTDAAAGIRLRLGVLGPEFNS
jgi:hypothetical protein